MKPILMNGDWPKKKKKSSIAYEMVIVVAEK